MKIVSSLYSKSKISYKPIWDILILKKIRACESLTLRNK